ncbi:unnamed protein product [Symbiodinium pilosum]|uniref:Uncharacterized protein n=1 Tax=Symbiodinium pilosum TaxID=2952 RepID=A0A812RX99_SYMPI|nr:unnamed protein product [Symbiodinium pilosum]
MQAQDGTSSELAGEALVLNLESQPSDLNGELDRLHQDPPEKRGGYTCLAVYGLSVVRLGPLERVLKELPNLQKIVLPDRNPDKVFLQFLKEVVTEHQLAQSMKIAFKDGTEVSIGSLFRP